MVRRAVGVLGVVAVLALAGCGGPPAFKAEPGKVRISPVPQLHGVADHPANITVDGTGLFVFTHGIRRDATDEQAYQANVTAVPDPLAAGAQDHAVQAWLGAGESLEVAGLKVTVLAVYPGDGEAGWADVRVTSASGDAPSGSATP